MHYQYYDCCFDFVCFVLFQCSISRLSLRTEQMREATPKSPTMLSEESIHEEEGWVRKAREKQIGSTKHLEHGDNILADMPLDQVMFLMNKEEERSYLGLIEEHTQSSRKERHVVHSTTQSHQNHVPIVSEDVCLLISDNTVSSTTK